MSIQPDFVNPKFKLSGYPTLYSGLKFTPGNNIDGGNALPFAQIHCNVVIETLLLLDLEVLLTMPVNTNF